MASIGLTARVLAHRKIEIIWADKAAAFLALGWVAILSMGWLLAILACGFAGACLLAKDTAVLALEVGLALVLPMWLTLTGLDALFRGPARRLERKRSA
jgi:hypothetical protein